MSDVVITANANDDKTTFTTGESLFSFRPETGTIVFEPGWYRVDQRLGITGTICVETGSFTMTAQKSPRPDPRAPRQEAPQPPPALPPDSKPPRLIRLLSWLRKQPSGRLGPPSGSPLGGL